MDQKNKFDFFKPVKRPSEDDSKCSATSKKSKTLIDLENVIRTQLLVPGCATITHNKRSKRGEELFLSMSKEILIKLRFREQE